MVWGKVDDKLHMHPKPEKAGLAAMGLWTLALSYSMDQLTDGYLTRTRVARLAGSPALAAKLAAKLCAAGLWHPASEPCKSATCSAFIDDDGWRFHEWSTYQLSRAVVEAKRAEARARMESVRANTPRTTAVRGSNSRRTFASGSLPPDPDPDPSSPEAARAHARKDGERDVQAEIAADLRANAVFAGLDYQAIGESLVASVIGLESSDKFTRAQYRQAIALAAHDCESGATEGRKRQQLRYKFGDLRDGKLVRPARAAQRATSQGSADPAAELARITAMTAGLPKFEPKRSAP
jgi:hypothetical protein